MGDVACYQKLSAAVLRRGLQDLRDEDAVVRDSALHWVEDESLNQPFGFEHLCSLFNLNAQWLRMLVAGR